MNPWWRNVGCIGFASLLCVSGMAQAQLPDLPSDLPTDIETTFLKLTGK